MAELITITDLLADGGEKRLSEVSFENGLKLLEELVVKVESGSLALDSSIKSYERGVALINHLRVMLSGAEEKLRVLQKPGSEKGK